ncbi:hypothetical protein ACHAXS_009710 [Conticribra weissflogii]
MVKFNLIAFTILIGSSLIDLSLSKSLCSQRRQSISTRKDDNTFKGSIKVRGSLQYKYDNRQLNTSESFTTSIDSTSRIEVQKVQDSAVSSEPDHLIGNVFDSFLSAPNSAVSAESAPSADTDDIMDSAPSAPSDDARHLQDSVLSADALSDNSRKLQFSAVSAESSPSADTDDVVDSAPSVPSNDVCQLQYSAVSAESAPSADTDDIIDSALSAPSEDGRKLQDSAVSEESFPSADTDDVVDNAPSALGDNAR